MDDKKITLSWDELNSRKVDTRLREQRAMARNRSYGNMNGNAVANLRDAAAPRRGIWYNTAVYMALFGLVGGLLGWGFGAMLQFVPNARLEAASLAADIQRVADARDVGKFADAQANLAIEEIRAQGQSNPYF